MRPGVEQLGGTDHPDAWLGQQPRRAPADEHVELSVEIVSFGCKGERALCGTAQRGDRGAIFDRLGWMAAQASAASQQLVGRQRAQLLAQTLGCVDDQRLEVVDRARAGLYRALPGGDQDPDGFPVAALAWLGQVLAAKRLMGGSDRVKVIGLGAVTACRPGRTVELDHPLALLKQVGREAGSVAAGAFDRPDPAAWCLLDGEPVNVQVAIGVGGASPPREIRSHQCVLVVIAPVWGNPCAWARLVGSSACCGLADGGRTAPDRGHLNGRLLNAEGSVRWRSLNKKDQPMVTRAASAGNQSSRSTERYLRGAEVAELLQVSSKTVARWAKDGKLPYLRTLGGHRRYPEPSIRALVDQLTMPVLPPSA
jgi:excisionase family DNA binding protein